MVISYIDSYFTINYFGFIPGTRKIGIVDILPLTFRVIFQTELLFFE